MKVRRNPIPKPIFPLIVGEIAVVEYIRGMHDFPPPHQMFFKRRHN